MEIDPRLLSAQERYKILTGCVTPRPIAVVSTVSPTGAPNVAPFSFFNAVGSDPMVLMFCPVTDAHGRDKDSLLNAAPVEQGGTGQFVVNTATEEIVNQIVAASAQLPYGESEFELTGLTPAPCSLVKPPRVEEAAVSFECQTLRIVRTKDGAPLSGNIVLGEVVHMWIRDSLLNEAYHVDPDKLRTFGRMGGTEYATTRDRFTMARGRAALDEASPFERGNK